MFLRILLLVIAAVLLMPAIAPLTVRAHETEKNATRIDTYFSGAAERNIFSGSVLVARKGEILLSKGYGLAVREWNIPNTPQTRFRTGIITGLFTATAIMMLQEQGSLSVNDPICKHLKECPEAWQNVTIHQLLTHTSGIPALWHIADFDWTKPADSAQIIEILASQPLRFDPGDHFELSYGYIILGEIIQLVSGHSYSRFLRENIFAPLGMADTGLENAHDIVEGLADGYEDKQNKAGFMHMSIPGAAEGLYSTVEDLYRFFWALQSGEIVSMETWEVMRSVAVPVGKDGIMSGYGIFQSTAQGHPAEGVSGTMPGFRSTMCHLKDWDVTTIVLSNLGEIDSVVFAHMIVRMIFPSN